MATKKEARKYLDEHMQKWREAWAVAAVSRRKSRARNPRTAGGEVR
jgi:hypothetical protein